MIGIKPLVRGLATYIPGAGRVLSRRTGGTDTGKYCYSIWLRHLVMAHEHGLPTGPKVLAELGVFFLMLHAGLETDHREILKASKRSFLIALGGTILSFIGGYYVARWFGQPQVASLFIGMGLSVSAIAMAARVFKDCKIMNTRAANVTLGAAVFENILALIFFSIIIVNL